MSILHAFSASSRGDRKPSSRSGRLRHTPEERLEAAFAAAVRTHAIKVGHEEGVRFGQLECHVKLHMGTSNEASLTVEVVAATAGPRTDAFEGWLTNAVQRTPVLRIVEPSRLALTVKVKESVAALRDRPQKRTRRWRPKNA